MHISEIDRDKLVDFTELSPLVSALKKNVKVWSWGAHGWTNLHNKFLAFRVNGHHFKGVIYVCVNYKDLFDIYLVDKKGNILHQLNDIYIDQFVDVIDEKIEKIPEYKF